MLQLSRAARRRILSASLRSRQTPGRLTQRRWNSRAPRPGDGPLMSRRADRELPDIEAVRFRWGKTLPIFVAIVSACAVAIFNYQKMSSPVIASTLYALRTHPRARELLGDEIYFRQQIPWIHGEMNQLRGRIDVWFDVKGTNGKGTMRFASNRKMAKGTFETTEWSLKMEGWSEEEKVDLLSGGDPFAALIDDGLDDVPSAVQPGTALTAYEEPEGKGFRTQKPYGR